MRVIVDDQIALLANLGALAIPAEIDRPLLTVYGFQLRIASGIVTQRATEGVFQRMVHTYLQEGVDPASLLAPETESVLVVDPTQHVADVARAKARPGVNLLAAEVIAVANAEGVGVRLSRGNASGALWNALGKAGVSAAVWEFEEGHQQLAISEVEGPVRPNRSSGKA